MEYKKRGSKFTRKYGIGIIEMAKRLNVSVPSISKWENSGFDLAEKAETLNGNRGNKKIVHLWQNLKSRCGNPLDIKYKYYGGKGIKLKLTKLDLVRLWARDKASEMKKASIDRIDSNKDYEINNCRFIEHSENCKWRSK